MCLWGKSALLRRWSITASSLETQQSCFHMGLAWPGQFAICTVLHLAVQRKSNPAAEGMRVTCYKVECFLVQIQNVYCVSGAFFFPLCFPWLDLQQFIQYLLLLLRNSSVKPLLWPGRSIGTGGGGALRASCWAHCRSEGSGETC